MLLVASETVARGRALPWHCSLLWVINAGSELNCFLHFPQRKTSSSSSGWIAGGALTLWPVGSGTAPWPSNNDWTAKTV